MMPDPIAFETTIPSNTAAGLAAQEKIVALMEQWNYSSRDVFAMRLSLEEAVTNAIRHGNRFADDKTVHIQCSINADRMTVVIRDQGDGFVPESIPDPTAEEYIERPSGRGLLLMRAYLTFCDYSEGGRCITMVRERNSDLPIVED